MPTLLTSIEADDCSDDVSAQDDVAALLVDCHAFVEAALFRRPGESQGGDAHLLLERLSLYVDWQTLH